MAKGHQLVVFSVGKEFYGVSIDSVQEIMRVPEMTGVPDAPQFLEGMINLRGRVIPLIDLRKRLRMQTAERTRTTRVLITEHESRLTGLLVDSVSEVLKIQPDSIEDPPEMISAIGIEYITGVVKLGGKLVILLDLHKIFNVEDWRRAAAPAEKAAELQTA